MGKKVKKLIFLNAGTKTRNDFLFGTGGDIPYSWYHTKRMMLHIKGGIPTFMYKGAPIDWTDAHIFTRLRGTDQLFCGMLYDYFAYHHILANDPISLSYEQSAEKIAQMLKLTLAGITVPESFIFREEAFLRHKTYILENLAFPFIFKTDGSRGRDVYLVENEEQFTTLIKQKKRGVRALVQPFIENTYDTRTIVAYGQILGTIKRARKSGYLNNIAQGASAEVYALTENERAVALKSAEVCGIDIAGVDMIHTPTGPIVLEVNKSPQVHGFESAHGFSVFEKIGAILRERMK